METKTFRLWENETPDLREGDELPTITYFPAKHKTGDGTVIVFPGGGYQQVCSDHEGGPYAEFLNEHGMDAFVVCYRIYPYVFPDPLLDARRAVRFVRANAKVFGIDPAKIAVMGSSAGGHLAALVSTYRPPIGGEHPETDPLDTVDPFPNATVLCYSVIDLETPGVAHISSGDHLLGDHPAVSRAGVTPHLIADKNSPQAFIWHTTDDGAVNVINSYLYATRLAQFKIPVELHVFPGGRHGMGLSFENDHIGQWKFLFANWLKLIGYAKD